METTILAALVASVVVGVVTLVLLRAVRRSPHEVPAPPRGRLRLPARTFERVVVVALVAGAVAVAPALPGRADVIAGAVVIAVVAAWIARRGAFLPLRAGDRDRETV